MLLAQSDGGETGSGGGSLLIPILLIGGAIFLYMNWQNRRRRKQAEDKRDSVEIGDEIRTVGGIYGVVSATSESDVTIDIGGGTTMRVDRRAIAERVGDEDE